MRVTSRIARTQKALSFGLVLLAACVSAGTKDLRTSPSGSVDRDVMTAAEISESRATTAYEAIERLRPRFLLTNVDLGPTVPRQVYLNGVALGGFNELRTIPASSVREIRFVRAIDSAPFGTAHSEGAILVISKAGR
jgi:hypothetical protein